MNLKPSHDLTNVSEGVLGICIPTYRRPELLRRCVISAFNAAGKYSINIYISDDSGDDTNLNVISELSNIYGENITHHKNEINLGIDNNIQFVTTLCRCDYIWLVGEDDFFLEGSVENVLRQLLNKDHDFILLNYAYIGNKSDETLGLALPDKLDKLLSIDDFLCKYMWATGFIGACVIRRELWLNTDPVRYKGTYYSHVGRIAEIVLSGGVTNIISKPHVANRVEGGVDNFTWKSDSYGVYFGYLSMCDRVALKFPNYSSLIEVGKQTMTNRYRWLSYRLVLRLRAQQGFDFYQFKKYIITARVSFVKKCLFGIISITPALILRPLLWLRTFRKKYAHIAIQKY